VVWADVAEVVAAQGALVLGRGRLARLWRLIV
jgi:hypothetical protein